MKNGFLFMIAFLSAQILIADCKELDDKQLDELMIHASFQTVPGGSGFIKPFRRECCVIDREVNDLCATWTVEPAEGVSLNTGTGEFRVDPSVRAGSTFTITINVQNDRKILKSKLTVYTPQQNPFVGMWKEVARIDCTTGKEFSPEIMIREIEFQADGQFFVTWIPFEVYRDYWGTYQYDLQKGELALSGLTGNHVPKDVDVTGTFAFQSDGSLFMKDFWFGTHRAGEKGPVIRACGHRLTR